jgi:hypothetical protein
MDKLRCLGVTIGGEKSMQLIQLDLIELHPAAIAKQHWALPRPPLRSIDVSKDGF